MSLINNKGQTAREQLQQRAEQSKTETENMLLKQALAESATNCEQYLSECRDILQQAEEARQQERKEWSLLYKQNEKRWELRVQKVASILKEYQSTEAKVQMTISNSVGELTDGIREDVTEAVRKNTETLERASSHYRKQLDEIEKGLDHQRINVVSSMRKFFHFENGFKQFVFWASAILSICNFGLLLYFCFIK